MGPWCYPVGAVSANGHAQSIQTLTHFPLERTVPINMQIVAFPYMDGSCQNDSLPYWKPAKLCRIDEKTNEYERQDASRSAE